MTTILGIDPGQTSGWCIYDTDARRAVASGQFENADLPYIEQLFDIVVIERPTGYFGSPPAMVECGIVFGMLHERLDQAHEVESLKRHDVKRILSDATHREILVKNDATAWAALKLLHGGEASAKKGGPLHGVKAHERAALAVAVAWGLRQVSPAPT